MNIEKEWITSSGLKALVIMQSTGHRCGYVAVPESSILSGKHYSEQLNCISQEQANGASTVNMGPMTLITAMSKSEGEHLVRRSLDLVIDVHQSLTFSNYILGQSTSDWWFGFDCGHWNDDPNIGGQTLEYCIQQCESMATQLVELEANYLNSKKGIMTTTTEQKFPQSVKINTYHEKICDLLVKMNHTYELPVNTVPTIPGASQPEDASRRLRQLADILHKEVAELEDTIYKIESGELDFIGCLVELADLLADVIVYCRSEALRWGIPIDKVLLIVMESNMTKLGEDGKPIKDENDKFLKGPNFVSPEPAIYKLLQSRMENKN